jgi:hypothetical protein
MDEYLFSFIFADYTKDLLAYLIPTGYLMFGLYFYGSKKWEAFSDFDKIACTIMTCYILLNFLVIPIGKSLLLFYNFFFYSTESGLLTPVKNVQIYNVLLLVSLLYLALIRYESSKPIYEDTEIKMSWLKSIFGITIGLFSIRIYFYVLGLITSYSTYYDYLNVTLLQSTFQLFFFLVILLVTHGNYFKNRLQNQDFGFPISKRNNVMSTVLFAFLIGYFVFTPTIDEKREEVVRITIEDFHPMDNLHEQTIERKIEKKYSIKRPIILDWVKVTSPFKLNSAKIENNNGENIEYNDVENYFIVNNLSRKNSPINVTTSVEDTTSLSTELDVQISMPDFDDDKEVFKLYMGNEANFTIKVYDLYIDLANSNYEPTKLQYTFINEDFEQEHEYTKEDESFSKICKMDYNTFIIIDKDFTIYDKCSVMLEIDLQKKV